VLIQDNNVYANLFSPPLIL